MNDSNTINNNLQGFKNSWMDMGDVFDKGKFLKEWQVRDKIIESIFPNFIQPFTNDSNSINNNS